MDKVPLTPYDFLGYLASGVVFVAGMDLLLGFPRVLGQSFNAFETAALLLLLYAAGQLLATPAKALLEDRIVGKLLKPPSETLIAAAKPRIRGFLFPGYYTALPEWARTAILKKADGKRGNDLFLFLRFDPPTAQNVQLQGRLAIFLNQYGFCRNLSFTTILVGTALLVGPHLGATPPANTNRYAITMLVAGLLLFYRYLKFYRQYCAELFLTYAAPQN